MTFSRNRGRPLEDFGEQGVLYKINYDNVYHLKYRRAARGGDIGRDVITEKYILNREFQNEPQGLTLVMEILYVL
jgi:hypothetical protein